MPPSPTSLLRDYPSISLSLSHLLAVFLSPACLLFEISLLPPVREEERDGNCKELEVSGVDF